MICRSIDCTNRALGGSAGQYSYALDVAERSFEKLSEHNFLGFSRLAIVEIAASLLALGDSHGAEVWLGEETDHWFELNQYHALCAAAIRAVSLHRDADTSAAVDLLRPFADFIRRDNANWRLAMYSRSFPELLGLLGAAIGPERLPAHMLRMVLPEDAEQSLTAARGFMETEQWELLGRRVLGDEQFAAFVARRGRPICRVKLFGGLEVRADQHLVKESDWKKRKARLLFAMLVVRRGQDVPRDQILDLPVARSA